MTGDLNTFWVAYLLHMDHRTQPQEFSFCGSLLRIRLLDISLDSQVMALLPASLNVIAVLSTCRRILLTGHIEKHTFPWQASLFFRVRVRVEPYGLYHGNTLCINHVAPWLESMNRLLSGPSRQTTSNHCHKEINTRKKKRHPRQQQKHPKQP